MAGTEKRPVLISDDHLTLREKLRAVMRNTGNSLRKRLILRYHDGDEEVKSWKKIQIEAGGWKDADQHSKRRKHSLNASRSHNNTMLWNFSNIEQISMRLVER